MLIYKQTKQDIFTNEVNKILNIYGRDIFEYIAPCSIDKINNISTSVNDYTLFTDRYVDANLIKIDPIVYLVSSSQRTLVTFEEFNMIDNLKIEQNEKTQIISGKILNKHREDCKIRNGFYYIERHLFHNYLIIFGSKYNKFDLYNDILSNKEKRKWLKIIKSNLIKLMADMNTAVFQNTSNTQLRQMIDII